MQKEEIINSGIVQQNVDAFELNRSLLHVVPYFYGSLKDYTRLL